MLTVWRDVCTTLVKTIKLGIGKTFVPTKRHSLRGITKRTLWTPFSLNSGTWVQLGVITNVKGSHHHRHPLLHGFAHHACCQLTRTVSVRDPYAPVCHHQFSQVKSHSLVAHRTNEKNIIISYFITSLLNPPTTGNNNTETINKQCNLSPLGKRMPQCSQIFPLCAGKWKTLILLWFRTFSQLGVRRRDLVVMMVAFVHSLWMRDGENLESTRFSYQRAVDEVGFEGKSACRMPNEPR